MSIMAKTPSGYKKIGSAYLGERPVDKVFNANGDVVYALQRELTGVPPLLFKGKEQSELLNYRICGDTADGNSVGDLVESGEHAGEYKVPVTVEGKNLLQNTATSQEINGVTFTVNSDWSVTCNGTSTSQYYSLFRIPCYLVAGNYTISGCPVGGGSRKYRADISISPNGAMVGGYADNGAGATIPIDESGWYDYTIRIQGGYTVDDVTFKPMIRKADIEDDTYEPYHAPVTIPIYLPEPIKMVGSEPEYVDYYSQTLHRVRKNLANNEHTSSSVNYTITENDNRIHVVGTNTTSSVQGIILSNLVDLEAGEYDLVNNSSVSINVDYYDENRIARYFTVSSNSIKTFTYPSNVTRALNVYKAVVARGSVDAYFQVMIVKHGNDTTIYEPYIENTDLDVTLPALPTIKGTNTMSVDTEVQPSRMDIKGRIKTLT